MFTVLIVDDEPKICLTLRDILKKAGFDALYCTDPLETVPMLKSVPVDLLLIDVKMPGKDGIDLPKSVRAAGNNLSPPLSHPCPTPGSALSKKSTARMD